MILMCKKYFGQQYNLLKSELNDFDFETTAIRIKKIDTDDFFFKEKAVIFLYTTNQGRDLNNEIRSGKSNPKLTAFKNSLSYALNNIKNCPSYKNIHTDDFFRGSKINYDGISEKNIDDTFSLTNFVSTTYCSLTADIFEEGVYIYIESKEGIYISQYAENIDEKEVIFNINTTFTVWNKKEDNGILYIYIEKPV